MKKIKDVVLHKDHQYNTFPSIAKAPGGVMYVAFRQAPDRRDELEKKWAHVDRDAIGVIMSSDDNGVTWSKPEAFYKNENHSLQDPIVNVLSDGTILITFFLWEIVPAEDKKKIAELEAGDIGYRVLEDGSIAYVEGAYTLISHDGGKKYEGPYPVANGVCCSGRAVEMPDGSLLFPVYGVRKGDPVTSSEIYISKDKGISWEPYSMLWKDPEGAHNADEPSILLAQDGTLHAFIRSDMLYVTRSTDGGKTWGECRRTDILGNVPFRPLLLKSGNILLSYGHRAEPFGIRALLLDEYGEGIVKSKELILREDGSGFDISYCSAEQADNGDILMVYYYNNEESDYYRHIAGTWLRDK